MTRVITKYSCQHKQVRNILNKHWHLLSMYATLAPLITDHLLITYRRASSLHDKLVHSEFKGANTGKTKYRGIYLLSHECGCYYVGKTILELWHQIYWHMISIEKKDPSLPLGRHSLLLHSGVTPRVNFWHWITFISTLEGVISTNHSCKVNSNGFSICEPLRHQASMRHLISNRIWLDLNREFVNWISDSQISPHTPRHIPFFSIFYLYRTYFSLFPFHPLSFS